MYCATGQRRGAAAACRISATSSRMNSSRAVLWIECPAPANTRTYTHTTAHRSASQGRRRAESDQRSKRLEAKDWRAAGEVASESSEPGDGRWRGSSGATLAAGSRATMSSSPSLPALVHAVFSASSAAHKCTSKGRLPCRRVTSARVSQAFEPSLVPSTSVPKPRRCSQPGEDSDNRR